MPATTIQVDGVVESMRELIAQYAGLIQEVFGDNARCLALFGTIAYGTFDPERQTIRNVLVLDQIDLDALYRLSEEGVRLGEARIAAPLIMTPGYIQASLDTFPLELIEIHQNHLVVFGDDFFKDLSFANSDVRLQCERELKTVLIGLRQGLLAAAGRENFLAAVETDIAQDLIRTMRGFLWFKGQKEPRPAREVIGALEAELGQRLDGVRSAVDPDARHGRDEFRTLYADVEALGKIVDAW